MSRPRLNPRQRKWLNNFLKQHPLYQLREVWPGLDGDRFLRLDGLERLPLAVLTEFEQALPGYRWHTLEIQLRKYGDARKTATHTYTAVYPRCDLNERLTPIKLEGQLSLPIPASVLAVDEPVNPVVVTWKPRQKLKPKHGVQLSLPIVGLEAELFALRQSKRPHLPPVSTQELLAEKTATWDWRNNTEVELPQVVIDLLLAQRANDQEWQNAIDLYQFVGLSSVMNYIDGLPSLRQYFGTTSATIASVSAAVARTHTKAKTTTVPVQARS